MGSKSQAIQLSTQVYNDYFAGTDQYFTNGIVISWLDDTIDYDDNSQFFSSGIKNIVNNIPFFNLDENKKYNAGSALYHIIITPVDTTKTTAQYDDIPYAGYVAQSFYLFEWNKTEFNEYRIEFGVVGKQARAEQVQNNFHSLIGVEKSHGWQTQLPTKWILNTMFRYGKISYNNQNDTLSSDWFNHYGAGLGNFQNHIFAGSIYRIGQNYQQNFNVHYPYLKEEASLLKTTNNRKGFGWALSGGINIQAVSYLYILDKAKEEGYKIDKKPQSASLYLGLDLLYNSHKLTGYYQAHSSATYNVDSSQIFGGFMYSYQF